MNNLKEKLNHIKKTTDWNFEPIMTINEDHMYCLPDDLDVWALLTLQAKGFRAQKDWLDGMEIVFLTIDTK